MEVDDRRHPGADPGDTLAEDGIDGAEEVLEDLALRALAPDGDGADVRQTPAFDEARADVRPAEVDADDRFGLHAAPFRFFRKIVSLRMSGLAHRPMLRMYPSVT